MLSVPVGHRRRGEDLRDYVVKHLGAPGAVQVIDETGDVNEGNSTVGVKRQRTLTAGQIGNAKVAVCLAYAAAPPSAGLIR